MRRTRADLDGVEIIPVGCVAKLTSVGLTEEQLCTLWLRMRNEEREAINAAMRVVPIMTDMDRVTKIQKFSQHDEQDHIFAALGIPLGDISKAGTFLDIGAWHARDKSNVRALYELGWSGVLVEFSPEPLAGLIKEYGDEPRIKIIAAAVGLQHTLTKFHVSADALSTSNEENYERWRAQGAFYGSLYVPTITLEDINEEFDFVSIDTEGTSADLFKELLDLCVSGRQPLPRCICVEFDNRADECERAASAAGYRKVYESEENLVFAR